MRHGTQVTTPDGIVGYVLGWQDAPRSAPHDRDVDVFFFDDDGEPRCMTGPARAWTPTGRRADRIVLAHMSVWEAEQELIDAVADSQVCQSCGGRPGMLDDMYRCLC